MSLPDRETLSAALRHLVIAAGDVAAYCDRAEHAEAVERQSVIGAGQTLRRIAFDLSGGSAARMIALYAQRLQTIEARHPLFGNIPFAGGETAACVETWRELQAAQAEHDRWYHPDVVGMARTDQLHHYSFHVSKLAGEHQRLIDEPGRWPDYRARRLPDTLLFGLKLATVMGERLPDDMTAPEMLDAPAPGDGG